MKSRPEFYSYSRFSFRVFKKIFISLFIYLAVPGLSCDMPRAVSSLRHMGSSFLTGIEPWAPCIGSTES